MARPTRPSLAEYQQNHRALDRELRREIRRSRFAAGVMFVLLVASSVVAVRMLVNNELAPARPPADVPATPVACGGTAAGGATPGSAGPSSSALHYEVDFTLVNGAVLPDSLLCNAAAVITAVYRYRLPGDARVRYTHVAVYPRGVAQVYEGRSAASVGASYEFQRDALQLSASAFLDPPTGTVVKGWDAFLLAHEAAHRWQVFRGDRWQPPGAGAAYTNDAHELEAYREGVTVADALVPHGGPMFFWAFRDGSQVWPSAAAGIAYRRLLPALPAVGDRVRVWRVSSWRTRLRDWMRGA